MLHIHRIRLAGAVLVLLSILLAFVQFLLALNGAETMSRFNGLSMLELALTCVGALCLTRTQLLGLNSNRRASQ